MAPPLLLLLLLLAAPLPEVMPPASAPVPLAPPSFSLSLVAPAPKSVFRMSLRPMSWGIRGEGVVEKAGLAAAAAADAPEASEGCNEEGWRSLDGEPPPPSPDAPAAAPAAAAITAEAEAAVSTQGSVEARQAVLALAMHPRARLREEGVKSCAGLVGVRLRRRGVTLREERRSRAESRVKSGG